jgi:hypothetical protein
MSDGDAARAKREDEAAAKRKRESVLSYWGAVVKDDRKLCKFNLGSLERKMFSWSVQDIFNRNLLRQQVTYYHLLGIIKRRFGYFLVISLVFFSRVRLVLVLAKYNWYQLVYYTES